MFTGYVLQRYPHGVRVLEGIGVWGGEFAVMTRDRQVKFVTNDRDEAEMVAEEVAEGEYDG